MQDGRTWIDTGRPGERATFNTPLPGFEVVSVVGTTRQWSEYHLDYSVAFLDRGQHGVAAEWQSSAQNHVTLPGGLMLFEPGTHHRTIKAWHAGGGGAFSVLRFSPQLMRAAARERELPDPPHFRSPNGVDGAAYRAVRGLVGAVARGGDALDVECALALALGVVLDRLTEAGPARLLPHLTDARVRAVKEFLENHVAEQPSLDLLAGIGGMSRFALAHSFTALVGISPYKYWTLCRVAHARRSISAGVPVKYVAADFGFSDEAHLIRTFKKFYAVSPGRWASGRQLRAS